MDLNLIVAVCKDGSIGKNGDLVRKISADLKRFKTLTTGHPVIMGRATWESLPRKPLPGRRNIVITSNREYVCEGAEKAYSPEDALRLTKDESPFVIGGGKIYEAMLPYANRLYLTEIDDECSDADTWFHFSAGEWELAEESELMQTEDGPGYRFKTFERKRRK